jgi:glycosyltransferase involved in cell wall biosynthesis
MPAVSVIIPTRNRHHLLPRSLGSALEQTFQDLEIIVVDDNIPEKRIRKDPALKPLLERPQVRVIEHDTPRNAATARNCGVAAARGEWVTFLDDDDAYEPRKVEAQWKMATETGLPVGLCGVTFFLKNRQRVRVNPLPAIPRQAMLMAPFIHAPSLFCRRDDHLRYDENLFAGEDAHFLYRTLDFYRVDRVFNVPDSLMRIYPQIGPRVNLNAEAWWKANMAIYNDFAASYGAKDAALFLARAELQNAKLRGGFLDVARKSLRVLKAGGSSEARLVLNTILFKIPWTRPLVVS